MVVEAMMLKKYTKLVLQERSRFEQETGKTYSDDLRQRLMSLATDEHPAKYVFTMTDVERIGINVRTSFSTPAGVYFYPLTKEYCQKLFNCDLPFAGERKFVGLVKLRGVESESWLKFLNDGHDYADKRMLRNIVKMDKYAETAYHKARAEGDHWGYNTDSKIFDIGNFYANIQINARKSGEANIKSTTIWNRFLTQLGFIGIYDGGTGTIYEEEPAQLVCLTPAAYEIVDIFERDDIEKRRDLTVKYANFEEYYHSNRLGMPNFLIHGQISESLMYKLIAFFVSKIEKGIIGYKDNLRDLFLRSDQDFVKNERSMLTILNSKVNNLYKFKLFYHISLQNTMHKTSEKVQSAIVNIVLEQSTKEGDYDFYQAVEIMTNILRNPNLTKKLFLSILSDPRNSKLMHKKSGISAVYRGLVYDKADEFGISSAEKFSA